MWAWLSKMWRKGLVMIHGGCWDVHVAAPTTSTDSGRSQSEIDRIRKTISVGVVLFESARWSESASLLIRVNRSDFACK